MDLALNNLQRLICHKNQPTNQPTIWYFKSAITSTISKTDDDHLIRVCQYFQTRIEAAIDANGGFFEWCDERILKII